MKTKFILNGGFNPDNQVKDNSDFYKEILRDTSQKVSILIVPFAKEAEKVIPAVRRVSDSFNQSKRQKEISFITASEVTFVEDIKLSDIIYFQGGKTLKLMSVLKKYNKLENLFSGKIVAGESAGASVFGKFFYSASADSVFEGLGILPIKVIPHYKEEYKDVFTNFAEEFEVVCLEEYESKVFYFSIK